MTIEGPFISLTGTEIVTANYLNDVSVTHGIRYWYHVVGVYINPDGISVPSNLADGYIPLSEDDDLIDFPVTALLGNFPNPFNPYTTIGFTVGAGFASIQSASNAGVGLVATHVTLDIFNIRGQRVRTLVSGIKEPGHHSVTWDSTDDRGQSVSSGIYFYRLKVGDFVETQRMLLLK
jgi:hypothetical protein